MESVVLCYVLALATVLLALAGLSGHPRLFWLAALSSWLVSYAGEASFGSYTLGLTFVFVALACGHSRGRVARKRHILAYALVGVGAWAVAGATLGEARLLSPARLVMRPVLASQS